MNSNKVDVQKLDKNMNIKTNHEEKLKWLSPKEEPFMLAGFPWFFKEQLYRRLPKAPKYSIREEVDILADCTAGGQIRIRTNSERVAIRAKLSGLASMVHMPATGQCGFDCYVGMEEKIYYCNTTRYDHTKTQYELRLFEIKNKAWKNVIINFPLYQGVEEVFIGIDQAAELEAPLPYSSDKRVIFYGTSITQGGCASRPGMAYTNILSRYLNMEIINLGFSGNGKGETEMSKIITEIERPACLILDYEANCDSADSLGKTLPKFIEVYRNVHQRVPVLVVSRPPYAMERFDGELHKQRMEGKQLQRKIVEEFSKKGDSYIYFYDGEDLLGHNYEDCTVDGVHPTDLGFLRMAEKLEEALLDILYK
jgi:lysophospholipase L1-like esterase